jgi:hypothetical protein
MLPSRIFAAVFKGVRHWKKLSGRHPIFSDRQKTGKEKAAGTNSGGREQTDWFIKPSPGSC